MSKFNWHWLWSCCLGLFALAVSPSTTSAVDFQREIRPILESACLSCHNEKKPEGGLRLDTRQHALTGGDSGPAIVPGRPEDSGLLNLTILPPDDAEIMPPKGRPLAKSQTERLKQWIAAGAPWPADVKLQLQPRMDFVLHVQPILEQNCLACHQSSNASGELSLSTREQAMTSGDRGPAIIPFAAADSRLYQFTIAAADAEELMPPADKGGPLPGPLAERLGRWIAQGAVWPDNLTLTPKAKAGNDETNDNLALVARIHAQIVKQPAGNPTADEANPDNAGADEAMADYAGKVPQTGASYEMVAVPRGEFTMGSPASEAGRQTNEGPQRRVRVDPFWIGKHEVTWDEYEPFMITQVSRRKNGARIDYDPKEHGLVDAVSQPTPPYMEMSFGMGQRGYPAISMTQHGANKYCQWLSAQTGHFYRLPTEAEWEYACRAGTTTAYSFGDDPAKLGEYAWYYDNSNEKYQKVGLKKPNPWGLHDMHGNVMEWTADAYAEDYFDQIKKSLSNPLLKPQRLYPRSVRGGGWDDDPERLRSAARRGSAAQWKQQDPQLPKSVWYHTDARWLGFRIVRPLKTPAIEEMNFYWNSATNAR